MVGLVATLADHCVLHSAVHESFNVAFGSVVFTFGWRRFAFGTSFGVLFFGLCVDLPEAKKYLSVSHNRYERAIQHAKPSTHFCSSSAFSFS